MFLVLKLSFVEAYVLSSSLLLNTYASGGLSAIRDMLLGLHHLYIRTVPTTAEGTPFSGSMNTALCDF